MTWSAFSFLSSFCERARASGKAAIALLTRFCTAGTLSPLSTLTSTLETRFWSTMRSNGAAVIVMPSSSALSL